MHRIRFGPSATHADLTEFKQIENQRHGGLSRAGGKKNFAGYDACSGPVIWDGSDLQQGFLGQGRRGPHAGQSTREFDGAACALKNLSWF